LDEQQKNSVSRGLWHIFYAFASKRIAESTSGETVHIDVARADEICAALAVLSKGSKSEKLDHVFRLFNRVNPDPVNDSLGKRQMWRFIRAFRTVLNVIASAEFANSDLSTFSGSSSSNEDIGKLYERVTNQSVDDVCTSIVEKMFAWLNSSSNKSSSGDILKNRMTFEDFAQWYTVEGFRIIPWLELLDLRKWRMTYLYQFFSESQLLTTESDEESVFEFLLNGDGNVLAINADHVDNLTVVVKATGIYTLPPRHIFKSL
ncbi:unnamed protein product, partial [marine sediment metagenome]